MAPATRERAAAAAAAPTDTDADPDPIVASYSVFLKPALPPHQRLFVLGHPNRFQKERPVPQPTELRLKPASGMLELDEPIDYGAAGGYDRAKGMSWGNTLANATKAKAGGSHGLAGGFGIGGGPQSGRGGRKAAGPAAGDDGAGDGGAGGGYGGNGIGLDWQEAVRQDRVLRKQTLGGMCPPQDAAEAKWMVGVFDGQSLHLTPVTAVVQLRPQLHHIDAAADLERQKHRDASAKEPGGAGAAGVPANGTAGGSSSGGGGGAGPGGARAIHMTIKSADGDEMVTETMVDRLRAVQQEPWTRLAYVGDDDDRSWDAFDRALFLQAARTAENEKQEQQEQQQQQQGQQAQDQKEQDEKRIKQEDDVEEEEAGHETKTKDKGKGKEKEPEKEADEAEDKPPSEPRVRKPADVPADVPRLQTSWDEDDILYAISRTQRPPPPPAAAVKAEPGAQAKSGDAGTGEAKGKGKGKEEDKSKDKGKEAATIVKAEPGSPPKTRAGRGGRASTRARGGRAKAGTSRGAAMEVD